MQRKKILLALLVLLLAIINCNAPSPNDSGVTDAIIATQTTLALTVQAGGAAPQQSIVDITETPTATPTATLQSTATQCTGTVTANADVNVRTGPGTVYPSVGFVPLGGNVPLAGKSADGTWWYVQFPAGPGGFGWMAGSVTTASCVSATLPVVAAPPTPTPPPTATATPTLSLLLPLLPIDPGLFLLGDIKLQEVFLSTGGEIVVRVAVDPTSSLSGNVTYKVWVDGALKVTKTEALPAGSILYWSGETIAGLHTVKVKVDTPNDYAETNEGNNTVEVALTH